MFLNVLNRTYLLLFSVKKSRKTFFAFIVLIVVLSSMLLSVFAKENPNEGQPFQGILDAIDGMKESIAGQLDSLLDAVTGSKQEIIGDITESQGKIQGSISASEENIKDAIDEISGKIDIIQYEGLVIKSEELNKHFVGMGHWHGYFEINFSRPSIVKAIYIDPSFSSPSLNLHFYEARVDIHYSTTHKYYLVIEDYNPDPGEESLQGFEVLNKFGLHEMALPADSVFHISFEVGLAPVAESDAEFEMRIVYESALDSVCEMDFSVWWVSS